VKNKLKINSLYGIMASRMSFDLRVKIWNYWTSRILCLEFL